MPFVLLYLVVEIVALVALGSAIGLGWTLLILLVGALVGMWLARREGVRAAQAIAEAVTQRRTPHAELTDGMLVAAGGVLLFVPGLVTDVAGLLLLLPPVRHVVRNRLVRAAEARIPELRTARIRSGATIVDGDVVRPRADIRVIEGTRSAALTLRRRPPPERARHLSAPAIVSAPAISARPPIQRRPAPLGAVRSTRGVRSTAPRPRCAHAVRRGYRGCPLSAVRTRGRSGECPRHRAPAPRGR